MKRPQHYRLDLCFPVFANYRVVIVITRDFRDAVRFVSVSDDLVVPEPSASCEAFTVDFPSEGASYIYLAPDAGIGTIAHEAYHSVDNLMGFAGTQTSYDCEVTAYHLGYIVDKIVEFNVRVADRFKRGK